jgi:hypothetical protein
VQTFLNSDGPFPDNLIGTSETIASSTLNPLGWVEFSFSTPVNISANTAYWLVLEASDPDLISYWPLDEASGTRYDAHGSNHLTDNNTVTQAIGLQGSAAQFTRANGEFLNITHAAQNGLDITGPFTFATSFSLDSLPGPTGFHFVLGGKFGGGGNRGWVVYVYWATNTLRFITSHDGTTLTVQDHPTVLTTGVRYFACARYDGSQMHLRLNATDASALNQAGGIFNNSANFQIGTYGSAALLCHNGSIDEAGFWQRALTNAEVTYLYNLGRRRNYQASRVFPDAANDIQWGADGSAPAYANGDMRYQISGGEWLADGLDACFEVYAA